MEKQNATSVVLLDLSAAFDTVDHDLLLRILESKLGITDEALKWHDSYLRPRGMKVCINGHYSSEKALSFSVPQGSCSGANIFTAYCSPIQEIVPQTVDINGYADDHLLRKAYKAGDETKCLLE